MKKLQRSKTNRTFTGLLGGIGEYLNIDPIIVRLIFVFFLFVSNVWPAVIVYVIGWLVVPLPEDKTDNTDQAESKETPSE